MKLAYADNMWMVTMACALLSAGAPIMATSPPAGGRLLKVPKVYNALITSDLPLIPSRAETAATAAVGPVLLYSSQLPVVLQPQALAPTQQQHLDKLQFAQNQLQREETDEHQAQPQIEQQLPRHQQLPRQQLPAQQLPRQQQLPLQQLAVQQQLTRHRQQPLPVEQLPSRHQQQQPQQLYTQQLPSQQFTGRQQFALPQQYSQGDYIRQQQAELQHQKQLQVQQQKQLQLFEDQQQDTSYLPMPEVNSYQPPPSVHIDEIKNNKPPNTAIPDVPPPPLPVGRRQQSYNLSPPPPPPSTIPPTNHHVPYG